jgi:predicted metal-binding membrane protein
MALRVNIVRAEVVVIAALLGLAALAWFFTDLEMAGMDAGPGTDPGAFGFYTATWVLMMAAMMFPSLAPMVVVLRRLERRGPAPSLTTPLFAIGYLAVWTASGIVAYAALKAGRAWTEDLFAWHRAGQALAGAALSVAAAYEFTPLKTKCLRKCRSPFAFLTNSWQDGPAGALSMGARHGAWCLGCCWALMLALFALGAMSLTWMALLAALIAAEKMLPWRRIAVAAVAAVLVALGTGVAVAPADVPGLTLPGGMSSASATDDAHKDAPATCPRAALRVRTLHVSFRNRGGVERLWSRADANARHSRQDAKDRKPRNYLQTAAPSCTPLASDLRW